MSLNFIACLLYEPCLLDIEEMLFIVGCFYCLETVTILSSDDEETTSVVNSPAPAPGGAGKDGSAAASTSAAPAGDDTAAPCGGKEENCETHLSRKFRMEDEVLASRSLWLRGHCGFTAVNVASQWWSLWLRDGHCGFMVMTVASGWSLWLHCGFVAVTVASCWSLASRRPLWLHAGHCGFMAVTVAS